MRQEQFQKAIELNKEIEQFENIRKVVTDEKLCHEFIAEVDERIEKLKIDFKNL